MGFKFNPITGQLDIDDGNPQDNGTSKPTSGYDGAVFTCEISGDGRIYFWANNTRYYVSGIADPIVGGGGSGQPLGPFWWLVYAQS